MGQYSIQVRVAFYFLIPAATKHLKRVVRKTATKKIKKKKHAHRYTQSNSLLFKTELLTCVM